MDMDFLLKQIGKLKLCKKLRCARGRCGEENDYSLCLLVLFYFKAVKVFRPFSFNRPNVMPIMFVEQLDLLNVVFKKISEIFQLFAEPSPGGGGGVGLVLITNYMGTLRPKGVPFKFQVFKRVAMHALTYIKSYESLSFRYIEGRLIQISRRVMVLCLIL